MAAALQQSMGLAHCSSSQSLYTPQLNDIIKNQNLDPSLSAAANSWLTSRPSFEMYAAAMALATLNNSANANISNTNSNSNNNTSSSQLNYFNTNILSQLGQNVNGNDFQSKLNILELAAAAQAAAVAAAVQQQNQYQTHLQQFQIQQQQSK